MYEEAWHSGSERPFLQDGFYWQDKPHEAYRRVNTIFIDCHVATVDVPFDVHETRSGYDAYWYFYSGTSPDFGEFYNLAAGARDRL